MIKRNLLAFTLLLMLLLVSVSVVGAQNEQTNYKGEIIEISPEAETIRIKTANGDMITVNIPADIDLAAYQVGDWVLIKGGDLGKDSLSASFIKLVGPYNNKAGGSEDDDGALKQDKTQSFYCGEGVTERSHPVADKIAERHSGVSADWIMDHFCNGHGMGEILLALKTSEIDGASADDLLQERVDGFGWGKIWQKLGLIGKENEGHSPPGWLKKPAHAGPHK